MYLKFETIRNTVFLDKYPYPRNNLIKEMLEGRKISNFRSSYFPHTYPLCFVSVEQNQFLSIRVISDNDLCICIFIQPVETEGNLKSIITCLNQVYIRQGFIVFYKFFSACI